MSAAGRALSKALDKPGDWKQEHRMTIRHIPSGQTFWAGFGPLFFDGFDMLGTPKCLGIFERFPLYFKSKRVLGFTSKRPTKRANNALVAHRLDAGGPA